MEAILFSLPPTNPFTSQCPPPYGTPSFSSLTSKRRIRIQRPPSKSFTKPTTFLPFATHFSSITFPEASRGSKFKNPDANSATEASSSSNSQSPEYESVLEVCSSSNFQYPDKKNVNLTVNYVNFDKSVLQCIAKPIVYSLFCIFIGFFPIRGLRVCAIAAPVATEVRIDKKQNVKEGLSSVSSTGHKYSEYTRRLLETVSVLLRSIEEVRRGNGEIKEVEVAWEAVKLKKEELQKGIMSELYAELRELRIEKQGFEKRGDQIVDEVVKAKNEHERLVRKAEKEKQKKKERVGVERLEESLRGLEEEYNVVWERIGDVEDQMARKETVAMSFGVRELCFIERECEQLVGRFTREMRQKATDR